MGQRMRKTPLSAAERRANVVAMPRPRTVFPPPPDHLAPAEQNLWKSLVETYALDNSASLALLTAACESRGRARKCREQIDCEGQAVRDRFGVPKPHPLLSAEAHAHGTFLQAMKALRLDPVA